MAELLFHPDVSAEVKAAYDWYQQQAEGLGDGSEHDSRDFRINRAIEKSV